MATRRTSCMYCGHGDAGHYARELERLREELRGF
jgi:hypothetical protein